MEKKNNINFGSNLLKYHWVVSSWTDNPFWHLCRWEDLFHAFSKDNCNGKSHKESEDREKKIVISFEVKKKRHNERELIKEFSERQARDTDRIQNCCVLNKNLFWPPFPVTKGKELKVLNWRNKNIQILMQQQAINTRKTKPI